MQLTLSLYAHARLTRPSHDGSAAAERLGRLRAVPVGDVHLVHALGGAILHNRAMNEPTVQRDDLQSAIEARKELGAELEPAIVDSFVERIEQRLVERDEQREQALRRKRIHQKEMALGTMALGIPLLAIAAIFTGLAGVIAVSAALAVVVIVTAR